MNARTVSNSSDMPRKQKKSQFSALKLSDCFTAPLGNEGPKRNHTYSSQKGWIGVSKELSEGKGTESAMKLPAEVTINVIQQAWDGAG